MDPVQKKYKKALKMSEIVHHLQDIGDSSDEELNEIEVAILPPDEVEFSCTIDNVAENHPTQTTSWTSKTVTWRKCEPVHSEIQLESNTDKQCLKNMITELEGNSAVEIFENLLYDETLEYIVHETVTYAKHYKNDLNFNLTITVDEVIVKYFGHHEIKQFIKGKLVRFGYKLWALCGVSGYCYNFSLYPGKDAPTSASSNDGLGATVVKKLLEVYTDPRAHVVYFDKFFSSMQLLIDLKSQGFRATGKVRENRTKMSIMTKQEMKKKDQGFSDYPFDKNNEILCVKWHDINVVCLLTNFDSVEPLVKTNRYSKKEKAKVAVNQPMLIHNYNKNMGGVDKHDWLISKYPICFRGKKCYWSFVIRILDMSLVNAWIIYNQINKDETIPLLDFRRRVCFAWTKISKGKASQPTSCPSEVLLLPVRFDNVGHYMTKRANRGVVKDKVVRKNL
ncbi:unnamed protein product [Parnassius apollo]|uniref:(apollo) hypothetical protein n=1 Tax=Parnassius apollo TaxID=110799 RepID=A0A8S3WPF7_PARAO|nr:unnamed protein product [Parnassius apollo]